MNDNNVNEKLEKLEISVPTVTRELVESDESNFERMVQHNMIHNWSKLVLYSNGTYQSMTQLHDDSGHRKYGNTITFSLVFADTGSNLCTISSFSGNFSPGEVKEYPTTGMSDCVKDNFTLLKEGKITTHLHWECWKR
ncbi:hypothetical protein ACIQHV_28195 [Bacillus bombysepticus]|uniref:Uncharacterized protein n=1 Tax=Bacillus thuringiensis serovar kumamotoensis TaxID=132267 RepID=A0A9X6JK78_BACUK|nr:hypothetical protein [Bacillus thuringiensis]MEC2870043.1 hypothetical protein [Bacillus cereus]OTZ67079.1 hypothetical protein BK769_30985 [Bacillus thuringiensis serovar kumamtoensis]